MQAIQVALVALSLSQDTPPLDHDWVIETSAGDFGLAGGGDSETLVVFGSAFRFIPLHIYTVAAILAAGLVLFACLCVLALGRIVRRKPREQS